MAERHITDVRIVPSVYRHYRSYCSCGWTSPVSTLTAAYRAATDHYYATLPGAQEASR